MRLHNRKSRLQRLLDTVNDSLDVPSGIKFGLPGGGSGNALKVGLPQGKALKAGLPQGKALRAGLIAGGLAGLTAGSAGISSLRRRQEGARDDS
jgi:hypothetical protein